MNWSTQVFNYCERNLDPSFWGEPLNAVSNAAFLIAGGAALYLRSRQPVHHRSFAPWALCVLVIIIGIGSFLFHTFATRWAAIADVAPIGIFMLAYFGYALRSFLGLSVAGVAMGLAGFIAAMVLAGSVRCTGGPCLNGSAGYVPALAASILMGGLLLWRKHDAGRYLLAASLAFAVSLTFRTIDRAVCPFTVIWPTWSLGTHALWHVLNALVLYLLLRAAIGMPSVRDTMRA